MRYSKQRELVLNAVLENRVHPTADEVYMMVKEYAPNISLGTVYRNLNFLVDMNMIRKISVPNSSDRFDGNIHKHHHLICKECGNMFDIEISEISRIATNIFEKTGFAIDYDDFAFEGICKNCKRQSISNK